MKKLFALTAAFVLTLAISAPAHAQLIKRAIVTPSTSASDALTPFFSAAVTTAATVKSTSGNLYGWDVYNPNASVCFLQIFNTTSPILGTTLPAFAIAVLASAEAAALNPLALANFSTAISVAATTTATGNTTCATGMSVALFYN